MVIENLDCILFLHYIDVRVFCTATTSLVHNTETFYAGARIEKVTENVKNAQLWIVKLNKTTANTQEGPSHIKSTCVTAFIMNMQGYSSSRLLSSLPCLI